uniref:Zgc:153738 n=1 Tax=Myripristis murdjan TaxID=586833 RepID=A0A667W7X3_9TELE
LCSRTYNKLWAGAQVELSSLLTQELPPQPLRPERDRVVFFQRVATLYVRYLQIFRQLVEAHDQVVHPQKRSVIRMILDGVMGRVLELKNEMVEKEFSEYHYMDDVLQDLKLTPEAIEIPIPRYFLSERSKEIQERKVMLTNIFNIMDSLLTRSLSQEEAIKIIQVAERARQGRLRAKLIGEIHRVMDRQWGTKDTGPDDIELAVVCIQRVWRGYIQRKRTKRAREEELIFLGMVSQMANKVCTRTKQEEYEEDYQKSIVAITNKLRVVEGPEMMETMKEQIRQWFIECHDATGSFPDYPDEEEGGSALIFAEKTPQQVQHTFNQIYNTLHAFTVIHLKRREFFFFFENPYVFFFQLMEEIAAKEEEEANDKPKGKEEKKDKGKKDKGKKDKGKDGQEEEEAGLKMLPSAFLSDLEVGNKTFEDVWQNRSESTNFSQRHEAELIKEEKRKEIEAEIRLKVDELMRQELANWKLVVDKDKGTRGNPKKKKASKSGKKKKKDKDLTADSCFLLFLGDYSYLGTTLRQHDIEPMPTLSDVRQVLALYAVLPLGSQVVHEKAPLIKAILLAGPAGVGKKMLVHAICQETGANLFDLSPLNIAGKYPGKSGLAMMLHMVFKVARLMQPSVIWIGDAEKMFYKKVPKEEKELDPKRLKKDLPKVLKSIKGEDRVLVVGTAKDPLSADIKSLCKMYSKIILIPRPDYGSRYIMWEQLIRKNGGEVTKALDLSSLAKISDGYTPGHLVQVIRSILTERRILQQARRPLTAAEFVAPLAKIDPVFQNEEEALKNWYAKTPLGKKRAKAATGKDEEEAPVKGKDVKKKGKK